jgi:hypothetical protein
VGRLHVSCIHVKGMGRVGATKASHKELRGVRLLGVLARICWCCLECNVAYEMS